MKYYGQSLQDKWVCEMLRFKRGGYFVDVGAYDGVQTSNTYALEKELGWRGICVEANRSAFNALVNNRSSINVHAAVSTYNGECHFTNDRICGSGEPVECFTLQQLITNCHHWPLPIDYLSLDVEGHELRILQAFDFSYDIKLITVEHNLYSDGPDRKEAIYNLLTEKGFRRVQEDVRCLDPNPEWHLKPYEDWYENITC